MPVRCASNSRLRLRCPYQKGWPSGFIEVSSPSNTLRSVMSIDVSGTPVACPAGSLARGPHLEMFVLRHQFRILERWRRPRLRLTAADRLLWVWFSRISTEWRLALVLVQPATIVAWLQRGSRLFWTWKRRRRTGRPTAPADVRALIRMMSQANPLWGEPRIHGELRKLRIDLSPSTVAKSPRPVIPPAVGRIVAVPEVNGCTIATTAPPHSPRLTSLVPVTSPHSGNAQLTWRAVVRCRHSRHPAT